METASEMINFLSNNTYMQISDPEIQLDKRLSRRGELAAQIAENICFGWNTPRDVIIWMLINDGDLHRK